MVIRTCWTVLLLSGLLVSSPVRAQQVAGPVQPPSSTSPLVNRIEDARQQSPPVVQEVVARRQAELHAALNDLQQVLANSGTTYEEGWKKYLKWDDLRANAASADPDLRKLRNISERFRRDHNGLEMAKFLTARQRLRDYANAVQSAREASKSEYTTVLSRLNDDYANYQRSASSQDRLALARDLVWLQGAGAPEHLLTEFQQSFGEPNLSVLVSASVVSRGGNRPVDQVAPVRDVILGTRICGTGHMIGNVHVAPHLSLHRGLFCVNLTGCVYSNSVGYNGPATIFTTGATAVQASKPIMIDVDGIHLLPATAHCTTNTRINDIQTQSKLVNKIAWKRAGKQKGESEAVASRHAEQRIAQQLDQEVGAQFATAANDYQQRVRLPLVRRGLWPKSAHVSSDVTGININVVNMHPGQLAAPPGPKPTLASPHDITLQAHESYVANVSTTMLGGVELTDERLVELLKENNREVPEELRITDESEPWSITFVPHFPVAVAFHDNKVHVAVRADRFTRGRNEEGKPDQEVNAEIEIAAVYHFEVNPQGLRLVRDGDVTVDYVGEKKLSATQVATKTFLKRKFSSLFKPEFTGEGFDIPGGPNGTHVHMQVREVTTQNGWLVAGVQ